MKQDVKKPSDIAEPILPEEDAAKIREAIPELKGLSTESLNVLITATWPLDSFTFSYLIDRMASVQEHGGDN